MIYTILLLKKRCEKEILDDQYENDYFNCTDSIPNHHIGRKNNDKILSE